MTLTPSWCKPTHRVIILCSLAALLVLMGLLPGQYRWRIDYEIFPGNKSQLECFFQLNAVPGLHA